MSSVVLFCPRDSLKPMWTVTSPGFTWSQIFRLESVQTSRSNENAPYKQFSQNKWVWIKPFLKAPPKNFCFSLSLAAPVDQSVSVLSEGKPHFPWAPALCVNSTPGLETTSLFPAVVWGINSDSHRNYNSMKSDSRTKYRRAFCMKLLRNPCQMTSFGPGKKP